RGSQRRLPAFSPGGTGVAVSNCARQSPRRNDSVDDSGTHLSGLRSACWDSYWLRKLYPGRTDSISCFVCPHRSWLRHCLADGFYAGVPCHHQSISDSAVAAVRSAVPAFWSVFLVTIGHAD